MKHTMVVNRMFAGMVATMCALPVLAHHSQAMFDADKKVTLSGTVKEFQFSNPHCYIQLLVPNQEQTQGGSEEWSIEMGAPAHVLRAGWKANTLKPGDKITVVINPLRDGGKGGHYMSATGADGKPFGPQS